MKIQKESKVETMENTVYHVNFKLLYVNQAITLDSDLDSLPDNLPSLPDNLTGLPDNLNGLDEEAINALSNIKARIDELPQRVNDKETIPRIIIELCELKEFKKNELAKWLGKNENYLFSEFISPLLEEGKLDYKFPDMLNHPEQAYKAVIKNK